jgi:hypothetical protein
MIPFAVYSLCISWATRGEIEDALESVELRLYQPRLNTKEEWAKAKDPETVTNTIAAQTGLNVKLEKRKVKVLEVKKNP